MSISESYVTQEEWQKALLAADPHPTRLMLLAYADWLDEKCAKPSEAGWPQTFEGGVSAQGYLIRLGVECDKMREEGKDRTPEYSALVKQEQDYITAFNESLSKVGVHKTTASWIKNHKPLSFIAGLASHLYLTNSGITDKDFEAVSWLKKTWSVRLVDLMGTNVTDAGIEHLKRFEGLIEIKSSRNLTDDGVRAISDAPYAQNLQTLWLSGYGITNNSVAHIMSMPNLKYLMLSGTSINRKGFERLLDSPNAKNLTNLLIFDDAKQICTGHPNHIDNLELSMRILDSELKPEVKTSVLKDLKLYSDRQAVERLLGIAEITVTRTPRTL